MKEIINMTISKKEVLELFEKTVKNYYLIQEFEKSGQLIYHSGWYEAKSQEAADALSSFLISIRSGHPKGNFKIKLPTKKEISNYEKAISNHKLS